MTTLAEAIRIRTRERHHRPLLTVYDDTVAARTELSYATADNWAAKTANLLAEELGLGPGATAVLDLDGHWTAAVLTLACWKAGVAVTGPEGAGDVTCRHVARLHSHGGGPLLIVGDGLRAEPLEPVDAPRGAILLGEDVHAFADDHDDAEVTTSTPALVTATSTLDQGDVLARAGAWRSGIDDGARIGLAGGLDGVAAQLVLAGAVLAGASVVARRPGTPAPDWDRWRTERVTVAAVPGGADAPDGVHVVDLPPAPEGRRG